MTVSIRPPTLADRSSWEKAWSQYNAFYGRANETALSNAVIETAWLRLLDKDQPVFGFLATQDDEVIGLAHFVFHRNLIQIADTCYLQDLFTAPAARGRGVARSLLDSVRACCRDRGVHDIYWHTHEGNSTARRLYDRVARDTGFIVYRTDV